MKEAEKDGKEPQYVCSALNIHSFRDDEDRLFEDKWLKNYLRVNDFLHVSRKMGIGWH